MDRANRQLGTPVPEQRKTFLRIARGNHPRISQNDAGYRRAPPTRLDRNGASRKSRSASGTRGAAQVKSYLAGNSGNSFASTLGPHIRMLSTRPVSSKEPKPI